MKCQRLSRESGNLQKQNNADGDSIPRDTLRSAVAKFCWQSGWWRANKVRLPETQLPRIRIACAQRASPPQITLLVHVPRYYR